MNLGDRVHINLPGVESVLYGIVMEMQLHAVKVVIDEAQQELVLGATHGGLWVSREAIEEV